MMRSTLFSVLALGLSALVDATFSSPKSGDQWTKGKSQTISWDNSGMASSCDIHLVPAGATDTTTIISEIALSVSNSGSYSWTPDSSISVSEAEIIIVDSKKTTIISSVFALISSSGSYNGGSYNGGSYNGGSSNGGSYNGGSSNGGSYNGGSYNGGSSNDGSYNGGSYNGGYNMGSKETTTKSHETKTKMTMIMYTHTSHETETKTKTKTYESKEHETKTKGTGGETTSFLTIAVNGGYSYKTGSTVLTTVQVTTTVAGELTTYAMTTSIAPLAVTTSIAPPLAVTTEAPPTYYTSVVSNSSATLAVNATPTAITFTGAAPSSQNTYGVAMGCVVGLVTILLL